VHGALIDYRFRVKNPHLSLGLTEEYKAGEEQVATFVENGVLVELKPKADDLEPTKGSKKLKWVPHNVSEYFFFDEAGFLVLNDAKVYQVYGEYTETMREIYDRLRKTYVKLFMKSIHEEDLDTISFPMRPEDFSLNGLEHYLTLKGSPIKQPQMAEPKVEQPS